MLVALKKAAEEEGARAFAVLGEAYLRVGELSLARKQFDSAISLSPDYARTHAYLGHVLGRLGEGVAALEHLLKALELDPDCAICHYFLGVQYRSWGLWSEARAEFERALAIDKDNAAIYVDIAQTYLKELDYVSAETWLKEAVEREPSFRLILAQFYINHLIKVEDGLLLAREVIEHDPKNAIAYDLLGWAYYLTGRISEAESSLREALSLDPDLACAHYHLGVVLSAKGEKDSARWEYQRAMDLDMEGFYRERAEKALLLNVR
jgi:tetratricopeptide (TPR) repeat protein